MDNGTPDPPWEEIAQLGKLLGFSETVALYQPRKVLLAAIADLKRKQ